ncbi:hypothetical protein SRHO_G00080660 [Serrasalmus rhombeus]
MCSGFCRRVPTVLNPNTVTTQPQQDIGQEGKVKRKSTVAGVLSAPDGPEASPSFSAPPEPRSSSLDELNPILSPVTSGNENSTDKYPCKKRTQEVTPNVSSSTFNRTFPCKKRRIKINPSECPVHTMADTYPVQKILSQRLSKEGTKEVKVRWQQCSGCGIKWKDTWEPFNEIFP